ncbi:RNA polymerase-associated protein RapA [Aquisphaera giovannonii]|uniref:RNA polymerase-associated protein RapA n=1 Tax=Aquisphaera giovannonii TaxID=406548 RepID=A0A5B9VTH6_9BACT|nr:helicase-related protein [Aquisphaera giovannonii]QEH31806.1 RNA polymerase-associated protein RapA [Aquisphaera giovannonii]
MADSTTKADRIRRGVIISGPFIPEAMEVQTVHPFGASLKVQGRGTKTHRNLDLILSPEQMAQLEVAGESGPFDGSAALFRIGVEAHRLGLAYEYDPFFSLSIARVDPLPHQLEAVYGYFLKLPRIRFLLADDPGAGKTIMAGLLLKELKARGLVRRTLIVTPANLSFQWQRELKDKFREDFTVVRSDLLRANYGQNPWQDHDQLVTSVSWVSRIEDARDSLLRSRWDLVIVDEAHKMSAYAGDKKTLAYQLGEKLSEMTDHFLLMTATPHKGEPENFCLFLSLLDRDVYGNVRSLQEAMRRNEAPFYLRRTKEALVSFPDPDTGEVRKLFTRREVMTVGFDLDGDEYDFYEELTRYVEDQSIQASSEDGARGRAIGFTMALLQRRMASTIYAVRRTLQRMKDRREKILADPEGYRKQQIDQRVPDDFDELPEDEQQRIIGQLEGIVASVDPAALRVEIASLSRLIDTARSLEKREIESKLTRLKGVLKDQGFLSDPSKKLLLFTEHKDSLDYLVGDGRDGRPLGKLREWGLTVTQIHGGMKIGDRDTPGTRIYAEREFREAAQVLVATEAAGEGINLQFCSQMINYDIPWNPVRLEQRIGRIHRYGQEHDCIVFNFVSRNTREGRVLDKLLERLREIRNELGTDQVFDVVGEIFPANFLDKLFRDLYARRTSEHAITDRIVRETDPERFRQITESALEGLARRELNLHAILGKTVEAREGRLVPEAIEDFFVAAAPVAGVTPQEIAKGSHTYRVGKVPRQLIHRGNALEPRFGKIGREYGRIAFDKEILKKEPTLEWVTPGHPLFEAVRDEALERVEEHLRRGAIFLDIQRERPGLLDVFAASVQDGRGRTLHRRLFVVETDPDGRKAVRRPTLLHDINPAPEGTAPAPEADLPRPERIEIEAFLYEEALSPWLAEIAAQRAAEIEKVARHVEISLNALIDRGQVQYANLESRRLEGKNVPGLEGLIAQAEQHVDELNNRLEARRRELDQERHCTIGAITHIGRAMVLPHPDRQTPQIAPMVRDDAVERLAVKVATEHEEARGCVVESVESEDRGFDLISRRPHPEDPKSFVEVRFIEVKGRAGVGEIFLSANEYKAAERLKGDYWLYAVFNCAGKPELNTIRDPARLDWQPVTKVEQYKVRPSTVKEAGNHE